MSTSFTSAPTSIRAALAFGIAGSAFASGAILSISWMSIPALLKAAGRSKSSSSNLATQWECIYNRGKLTVPPFAATVTSSYIYLAYALRKSAKPYTKLFALAGLLTIGIVPFTIFAMEKTNCALLKISKKEQNGGVEGKTTAEAKELAENWMWLNATRAVFPLAGAVAGVVALFS